MQVWVRNVFFLFKSILALEWILLYPIVIQLKRRRKKTPRQFFVISLVTKYYKLTWQIKAHQICVCLDWFRHRRKTCRTQRLYDHTHDKQNRRHRKHYYWRSVNPCLHKLQDKVRNERESFDKKDDEDKEERLAISALPLVYVYIHWSLITSFLIGRETLSS